MFLQAEPVKVSTMSNIIVNCQSFSSATVTPQPTFNVVHQISYFQVVCSLCMCEQMECTFPQYMRLCRCVGESQDNVIEY